MLALARLKKPHDALFGMEYELQALRIPNEVRSIDQKSGVILNDNFKLVYPVSVGGEIRRCSPGTRHGGVLLSNQDRPMNVPRQD